MKALSRFTSLFVVMAVAAGLLFAAGCDSTFAQTTERADPGTLPGESMYFMTSMSESIGTFFTFGDVNQAERSLKLSERRLVEARALVADGKSEEALKAVDRYQVQLARAVTKAKRAQANGDDADEVLSGVSEAAPRHQEVLAEVHQKVPEQARPGIERAMEASKRGHAQAKKARSRTRGRPDAPGRSDRGKRGPPDSMETGRPDSGDRSSPKDRGRPDSVEIERPDTTGGG